MPDPWQLWWSWEDGRAAAAWYMFLLVAGAALKAQLSDSEVLLQWPKGWAKASDRDQCNCPVLVQAVSCTKTGWGFDRALFM